MVQHRYTFDPHTKCNINWRLGFDIGVIASIQWATVGSIPGPAFEILMIET